MEFATSILLAVIFLITIFFIYNRLFNSWNYWTSRGIPSVPGPIPIFGNTLSIFRLQENMTSYTRSLYDANRDKSMVGFYNIKQPTLMLRDPELVKTVMQSSFNYFQHNEAMLDLDIDPLLGRDIFFLRGQPWKNSRVYFTSAFSSKRVKNMTNDINAVCKKMKDYLKEQILHKDYLELDAKTLFSRYTTDVAARVVFSIEGNSFVDNNGETMLEAMKKTMDPSIIKATKTNLAFFLPALSSLLHNSFVPSDVDKFFRRLVNDVENIRRKDGTPRNDVLQLMLDLEKEQKIPRADVLAHVFTFYVESYETSSLTLSFMSYLLGKHPEVQEELRREVKAVLEKHEGQLTYEAISELSYTEQVLNETLRLYPPGGVLSKVCAEKYRLEGFDGLSLDVEPDTTLLIPVAALHRDPEIWENPDEFKPERFRKGNNDGRHKFTHLPFGEGPRACPGSKLASMQVKAAIATIVHNYHIEVSPKMKEPLRLDRSYFMATAEGGYWIRLKPVKVH